MSGNKKSKIKISKVGTAMLGLQFVLSFGFCLYIYNYGILPNQYFAALCAVFLLLCVLSLCFFLGRKNKLWKNIVGSVVSVLVIAVTAAGFYYVETTFKYVNNMGGDSSHETINILVLKDTGIEGLNDIKQLEENSAIGVREMVDEENTRYALEQVYEQAGKNFDARSYADYGEMLSALTGGDISMMVVNDKYMDIINKDYPEEASKLSVAYTVEREVSNQASGSSYATTPFVVYIRGVDARDDSFEYGNADVNIIATVNPLTKQILLASVPRDYYVPLYGDSWKMDKLTHAGAYGMDCSIETLEDLLEVTLDYYVIVNFDSVVNIVDALGGIEVESMYSFNSSPSERTGVSYYYAEGTNTLNGEEALSFVRERYRLPEGDKDRGKNQEALITGLIKKVISPAMIKNYTGVMDSITSNVQMNIPTEMITSLIQMQLNDMADWNVVSISLDGYSAYSTTYSYPSQELYVMKPYENTIETAIEQINNAMNPGPHIKEIIKSKAVVEP